MEVVSERYVNWQSTDEEEEDTVQQLIERKPKHRVATSFDSKGGESSISETEDRKLDITTSFGEIENDRKLEELKLDGVGWSGKNVYFDDASGTGFSNGTSGVQTRTTYVSVSEDGSTIRSSEVTDESVTTTTKGSRTIITTQHKTINDFERELVQANVSQHSDLNSAVNGNGHVLFSNQNDHHINKDTTEELGVILEGHPEPIDYDVEGVLKKQETHDLICPNCHTCITRRVILKKRKRVIRDVHRDPKRDRTEETLDSDIRSPPDILRDTVDENSANTVDNTTDGQSQNDVITCWSCFSLLIPSGRGFKLFKVFGSTKQPEVSSLSTPNQTPAAPNQTPLLKSDDGEMLVDQGNTVNPVQLGNGNAVDQKPNIVKKGGDYKLFWSYGNSRDENDNSSYQISNSQTNQFTASSEETTNGTTLSNHVEVNSVIKQTNLVENPKQTNSLPLSSNGLSSVGTDYLAISSLSTPNQTPAAPNQTPSAPNQTPLLKSDDGAVPVDQGHTVNLVQLGNGNTVDPKPNIVKKGGDHKLFWSYGNSRDENVNSSHQISNSQTNQFTTSSEETTNGQGTTLSNHVEVNSVIKQTNLVENPKQTNSLPLSSNGLPSVGTGYLATTHAENGVKGQKNEADSNVQNVSSTILYSHNEYQMKVNDKPDSDFDSIKDREALKSEDIVSAIQGSILLDNLWADLEKGSNSTTSNIRDDVRISIESRVKQDISNGTQNVSRDIVTPETKTQAHGIRPVVPVGEPRDLDIIKSIVYGGLIESITSLGVVSSAAGAETDTINVLALGLSNLIGGLILIFHNMKDLKKSAIEGPSNQVDRYYETLGRRNHIKLHAVIVVLSFVIFGLIPIVTYAFTFRTSDKRDYKSLSVIGASLICITLLSMGKAHTKNPPRTFRTYINSITYYLSIAIAASGLSYIAGKLLQELIGKTGWFDTTSSLNSIFPNTKMATQPAWGAY